jgi:hypothetical protein
VKHFIILSALIIFPFAWFRGGPPERWVATILAISYVATLALQNWFIGRLQIGVALLDVFAWLAFVALALRYDRWWLLLATSAQTLNLLTHQAAYLTPDLSLRDNYTVQMVFAIGSLYAVLLGVMERRMAGEPVTPLLPSRLRT